MMEKKIEKLISELKEPIKILQEQQELKLQYIIERMDDMIRNKDTSITEIEYIFDNLLELTYWYGEMIKEHFNRLIDYVEAVNPKRSKIYQEAFLEAIANDK